MALHHGWKRTFATIVGLIFFSSLGIWQLYRAQEKAALFERYEERSQDAPLDLDGTQWKPDDIAYRHVLVRGNFLPGRLILHDNRIFESQPGYHVLTPLVIEGTDTVVLVNRGWVPVGPSRQRLPVVETPEGPVKLTGVVQVPGKAIVLGPEEPDWGAWPKVVQKVEPLRFEKELKHRVLPYVLRLDPGQPYGFDRDWRPYYGIGPDKHRAYALQWFSFAIILLVIYLATGLRARTTKTDRTHD